MKYKEYSHRYGLEIVNDMDIAYEKYIELTDVLTNIKEVELINAFQKRRNDNRKDKSLAKVINALIKERLSSLGWEIESPIFKNKAINRSTKDWRLDFVSPEIFSVEVAFNHSSAITVNLMKPVLASELNHVEKQFQTKFGIVIAATQELKIKGGFDGAIGTFEKYVLQCQPLMNQLTVPMIIIGLEAPEYFNVLHSKANGRTTGKIYLKDKKLTLDKEYLDNSGEIIVQKSDTYE
ncbi:hypothetical protein [Salinicoccus roseus]|uniref:hypothetical protein n=1 Tax=Salinicoccus roseus TaxID=45670 RepID=UPI0022FFC520|nr:hypothetical protein [Salinicoccus roseus]